MMEIKSPAFYCAEKWGKRESVFERERECVWERERERERESERERAKKFGVTF